MRREDEPRKACDNCKHFVMHFYRSKYDYWIADECGECKIRKFTEEERTKLPCMFVCDKWEKCDNPEQLELKNQLTDITARLILIVKALSK